MLLAFPLFTVYLCYDVSIILRVLQARMKQVFQNHVESNHIMFSFTSIFLCHYSLIKINLCDDQVTLHFTPSGPCIWSPVGHFAPSVPVLGGKQKTTRKGVSMSYLFVAKTNEIQFGCFQK